MTDKVILPLMDGRWIALSPETFQKGLQQGSELIQQERPKQQDEQKPIWLSVPEVARLCNISETFLRDEISLKRTYWEAYQQWPREIELEA